MEEIDDGNSRTSWPETFSQVDLETLRELPKELALEIERDLRFRQQQMTRTKQMVQPKMDSIFTKKLKLGENQELLQSKLSREPIKNRKISNVLTHEPFEKVYKTIQEWINQFETCPHDGEDLFFKSCIDYFKALLEVKEYQVLKKLLNFLLRFCGEKNCQSHPRASCWKLAMEDVYRQVFRIFRENSGGSHLII